ncbi:MAG: hypothetical protein JXB07_21930 [Anaerolineae bacterium]|nr:hypothetical protein [Anaerolineae bacterium]
MNKHVIVLIGVSIFAITLAVVIGSRLTGQVLVIALGIALGIVIGIPVGALTMVVGLRSRSQSTGVESGATTIVLTDQQTDLLIRALERPQTSPDSFTLPPRQDRSFSVVGGADLSDTFDDAQ